MISSGSSTFRRMYAFCAPSGHSSGCQALRQSSYVPGLSLLTVSSACIDSSSTSHALSEVAGAWPSLRRCDVEVHAEQIGGIVFRLELGQAVVVDAVARAD